MLATRQSGRRDSDFYSDVALALGGRPAAINAIKDLIKDYALLIADCEQKILELQTLINDQTMGNYKGRPPSKLESTLSNSILFEQLNYLQQLKLASSHNLSACHARLKELRA